MLCMMMSTIPFYYLTLETYYLGVLNLPPFSGPDDASIAHFIVHMYTAYCGSVALWQQEYNFLGFGELRTIHLGLYVVSMLEIFSVISGVTTNLWHARNSEGFQKAWPGKRYFFSHVSYMASLCSVFMGYVIISPSVMQKYPIAMMFAYGSQFLQGTLRALISGVTREKYQPYRRTNTTMWSLMIINAFSIIVLGHVLIDELALVVLMNLIGWGAIAHQVYWTIQDFKRVLGIRMFRIK
jgi:hypothetical protein